MDVLAREHRYLIICIEKCLGDTPRLFAFAFSSLYHLYVSKKSRTEMTSLVDAQPSEGLSSSLLTAHSLPPHTWRIANVWGFLYLLYILYRESNEFYPYKPQKNNKFQ